MKKISRGLALFSVTVFLVGCSETKTTDTSAAGKRSEKNGVANNAHADETGQDADTHAKKGPHGGHLFELGKNHEYNAELVRDQKLLKSVTIYFMDGDMKAIELSQDQQAIILKLTLGDEEEYFALSRVSGNSFWSSNGDLMSMIDKEGVAGRTLIKVSDQSFHGGFTLGEKITVPVQNESED